MHRKLFLLTLLLTLPLLCSADYPQGRNEYVNDFANVLGPVTRNELRKKLKDVEYYSGVEITVLTINSYGSFGTGDLTWEAFATGLFNHWGVGNRAQNNGVLFLISTDDRKIRLELGAGYPAHYNSIMKSIIDENIAPLLKENLYDEGIKVGVEKIINATTKPVTFFDWYKWYILGGIGTFISLIIAFIIDKEENPKLFWVLLGLAGFLILSVIKGVASGKRSDGFGGGSSSGGGASGDF